MTGAVSQAVLEEVLMMTGMPVRTVILMSEFLASQGTLRIERRANPEGPESIIALSYTADGEWVLTVRA